MAKNIFIVMWDVDGVLVESEGLHREKHRAVMKRYGVGNLDIETAHEIPQTFLMPDSRGVLTEITTALHGTTDRHNYYWLLHNAPALKDKLTLDRWLSEELRYYEQAAAQGKLKERAGVGCLLRALHNMNSDELTVIQGIVTNGPPRQVKANLSVLQERRLLSFQVDAETVCEGVIGKSYISGQKLALQKPGLPNDAKEYSIASLAIEDSPAGIRQALSDGVPCIQWMLEGAAPYTPENGSGLYHAHTAEEVLATILCIAAGFAEDSPTTTLRKTLIQPGRQGRQFTAGVSRG